MTTARVLPLFTETWADTLDPPTQAELLPGEEGAHSDLKGIRGWLLIPKMPGLWDTCWWPLKTSDLHVASWGTNKTSSAGGHRGTQALWLSVSEWLGVPWGPPQSQQGNPQGPLVSLHVELLQVLGSVGILEQMTDRDTDDLDATPQSCDGGTHGIFGSRFLDLNPSFKASGEPSPGLSFDTLEMRNSTWNSTSPGCSGLRGRVPGPGYPRLVLLNTVCVCVCVCVCVLRGLSSSQETEI